MQDFNNYFNIFSEYTQKFLGIATDESRTNILLKIRHSENVCKNAELISNYLKLNSEQVFISQLCGIFHDIGRFEQYTKLKTFKDSDIIYHGQLGVEVLKKEKFLNNLDKKTKDIVLTAVYNHGLYKIEKYQNEDEVFFSKLTRDADKVDIFRIMAEYYQKTGPRNIALEYNLELKPEISEKVMSDFLEKKLISKKDLKTLNDFKMMKLSWIFDINFEVSRNIIYERKQLETIVSSIEGIKNKQEIMQLLTIRN